MFRSIGFIGGGRVTRILLGGWKLGQALPEVVRVSDPSADSLEKLRRLLPGIERFAGDNDPPASCDIVFLALHPPVIPGVLGEISSLLALTPPWFPWPPGSPSPNLPN